MGLETDPDVMTGHAVGPDNLVMGEPTVIGQMPPNFAEWVWKWVQANVPEVQRKAAEYGSNSLSKKGWRAAQMQGRLVDAPGALRLGISQYAVEKCDRVEDAMLRGAEASSDTWKDLAVYALMHLYVADTGVWQ